MMFRSPAKLLSSPGGMAVLSVVVWTAGQSAGSSEPPPINPFGPAPAVREDAMPGYIELSDGTVHPGQIYLTRDKRLKIFDEKLKRQREVPLRAVRQIDCRVTKQWIQKEWKFKELASDEKMFTGRTYPAREYLHTITLHDGRTIGGPLSGIVYVRPQVYTPGGSGTYRRGVEPQRYLLNKRGKGEIGKELESLLYVRLIKLGDEALIEGKKKAAEQRSRKMQ